MMAGCWAMTGSTLSGAYHATHLDLHWLGLLPLSIISLQLLKAGHEGLARRSGIVNLLDGLPDAGVATFKFLADFLQ